MKHVFIVNPAAGKSKRKQEFAANLQNFLKNSDLDYEIHRTLNKSEVGSFVKMRAESGEHIRFYACGGDGTVCDVLNGLVGFENAELAFYPCGTGNDFARNFTHPENFLDFEKLTTAPAYPVDAIRFNDTYSMNMLNIGIDCDINIATQPYKEKFGDFSYAVAAVKVLRKPTNYRMKYTIDGEEVEEDLLLCGVANGKYCGGGFASNPIAQIDDGLLDVDFVKPVPNLFTLGRLLLKYRAGTHVSAPDCAPYINYKKLKKFTLEAISDNIHIAIDGETYDFKKAEIECVPNAVKLAIPEGSEILREHPVK